MLPKVTPNSPYSSFSHHLTTLIGIIGLGITELILFLLTDCGQLYYMLSKVIATAIVLVWNYVARKVIVYK